MTESVRERAIRVLEQSIDSNALASKTIVDSHDLIIDLGLDSLALVELVFSIETEFNVEFDDDMIGDIQTVGNLIAAIDRLLSVAAN